MRRHTRLALLAVLIACALAIVASAQATVSIVWPNNNPASDPYFGVQTSAGVYYIARQCYNEAPTAGRSAADMGAYGNEIGPGYIFAAASVDPDGQWRTKARDYLDVSQSDPRSGGWAKFGVHVARSVAYPEAQADSMKELQTGICRPQASGPADPGEVKDPFYNGGVSHVDGVVGPSVSAGVASFGINVYLNDGYDDVLKVTYNYRIDDTHVRLWTGVRQLCNNGACPSGQGTVYVKEPKFTVGDYALNSADPTWSPYEWLLGVSPLPAGGFDYSCWNDSFSNYRVQASVAQRGQTLHCANSDVKTNAWRYKQQLWFKYQDTGQGVGPDCRQRCTWVIAKGATSADPTTASTNDWTATGLGLDQWAVDEAPRNPFKLASTQPSYCTSHYPSDFRDMRRWEIGGANPSTSLDGSAVLQAGLHGWTGGNGLKDCQNLARQMGSSTTVYSNYFEFAFQ